MVIQKFRKSAFTVGDKGGNPAGVVIADAFPSKEAMLAIAADFGYSETVFAVRKDDGIWRVRYFAPEQEVDFCGHATIALGATLGDKYGAGVYNLHINTGSISVQAHEDGAATLTSPPATSRPIDDEIKKEVLQAFRLSAEDIDDALGVHIANAGNDHVFVPVKSREKLSEMSYDFEPMKVLMRKNSIVTIALAFRESAGKVHIRNAFAFGGVIEDPATGAAASAVSGLLRDQGLLEYDSEEHARVVFLQGDDMGTPSRLRARISKDAGKGIAVSGTVQDISDI